MKLKPLESDPGLIDLAPLIDVVFLLLIFLMVASRFDRTSLMDLTLPQAGMNQKQQQKEHTVSIQSDGTLSLNESPVEKQNLKQKLTVIDAEALIVRADQNTPFKDFVFVMDTAKSAGLKEIKIEHTVK